MKSLKLDANELLFFRRQLESVKKKTYDVKYPNLKARFFFPVDTSAGPGATSITYRQYDEVGMAKIVANYAKDFPRVTVKGKEFISPIKSLGDSYSYTIQDIRSAALANLPLKEMEARAARRGMLQTEDQIAFFGDADTGLPGFLTNVNIPSAAVAADGVAASPLWSAKTPDQIARDVSEAITDIRVVTRDVESANTVIMPISAMAQLKTLRMGSDANYTIMKFLMENHPEITLWDSYHKLETAGVGNTRMLVAYNRSPDVLTLEIPWDFEQFPEQEVGLEFEVPCHQRIGGVIVYYPLACNFVYGF